MIFQPFAVVVPNTRPPYIIRFETDTIDREEVLSGYVYEFGFHSVHFFETDADIANYNKLTAQAQGWNDVHQRAQIANLIETELGIATA